MFKVSGLKIVIIQSSVSMSNDFETNWTCKIN